MPTTSCLGFHVHRSRNGPRTSPASLGSAVASIRRALTGWPRPIPAISRWLESEAGLLERYGDLIARTGYREARYDAGTAMPAFSAILDGQTLLFVRAWAAASEEDIGFIQSVLNDDLMFWRMVLADADILLTKMIAVAAVTRHFEMGNLVSRRAGGALDLPSSWRVELSDDERSMQRSLTGEWIYADGLLKDMEGNGTVSWRILSPFWQPQDLSNERADLMLRHMDAFDVPLDALPDVYARISETPSYSRRPFRRAYNLAGDLLMSGDHVDIGRYAVRVADLEGIRRAAVLAWRLRAAGVEAAGVESGLAESELSNPYTNGPFAWDGSRSEIVFDGLEPRPRGRHSFPY